MLTPLPKKSENRIEKYHRSPKWTPNRSSFGSGGAAWILVLSDVIRIPVHANTPGVFDRTGGHFHINGAHFGDIQKTKPAKCPD